jgi:hypothetical protein
MAPASDDGSHLPNHNTLMEVYTNNTSGQAEAARAQRSEGARRLLERIRRERTQPQATADRPRDSLVATVQRTLEFLHPGPDPFFEVRALDVPGRGKPHTASGYFRNHEQAAKAIVTFDEQKKPGGIYVTINPPDPRLYGRSPDAIREYIEPVTSDRDIIRRRLLLIDCDPVRPAKVMASDVERDAARALAIDVDEFLAAQGWPSPLMGDSGSGQHLLYRIDLPNDTESEELVKAVLKGLSAKLISPSYDASKPSAGIDAEVYNAARISRVFGTMNRKGLDTAAHRRAELFNPPDEWSIVSADLLRVVADLAPKPANGRQHSNGHSSGNEYTSRLMIDRWLPDRGQAYTIKELSDGRTGYLLEHCPFDPSHGDHREVAIYQDRQSGKLSAKCMHSSCQGRGWQEFKDAIGKPDTHHYDPPLTRSKASGTGSQVAAGAQGTQGEAAPSSFAIKFLTSAELDDDDFPQRYLIDDVVTEAQGGIISSRYKGLKTSISIDAAVSIASGTAFLGHYHVAEPRRVAILSAESGLAALQETARRVCKARGIALRDLADSLLWSTARLRMTSRDVVDALGEVITARQLAMAVIDPTYLYFAGIGESVSNLFAVGDALMPISDLVEQTGCTIVLVNHNVKHRGPDIGQFDPPELSEISMSGWAEWARFWVLLARRQEWNCDTGQHWLWMATGGSAGHAGLVGVDVIEGKARDPGGRRWEVNVNGLDDAREQKKRQAEKREAERREKREDEHRRKLLDALRVHREGETAKKLREVSGLNGTNFATAIRTLLKEGRAKTCTVKKSGKDWEGYRPCE